MTDQRRLESLAETIINVATGFLLSLFVWQYIAAPLYNIPVTIEQNLGITGIFTVSAVLRGYCWRRLFANGIHKKIHKLFSKGV